MRGSTKALPERADRRWRVSPSAKIAVGVSVVALLAGGVTASMATSNTTDVAITPLTPARAVTSGASVGVGKVYSFVASGGSTTVPSNAMAVQLAITVKGKGGGTVKFGPLGDPDHASTEQVSWPAGGTGAGTVRVNVGQGNKVSVTHTSSATAVVGVKITGYSTQITAASIASAGGLPGQVLSIDSANKVKWAAPSIEASQISESGGVDGSVLTQLQGGGVGWVKPAQKSTLKSAIKMTGSGAGVASLVPGSDAAAVTNSTVGSYTVYFGQDLTGCVATGSPGGLAPSAGNGKVLAVLYMTVFPQGVVVTVNVPSATGTPEPANTSFMLVLNC